MDKTEIFIYNEHIRLRRVTLSKALSDLAGVRGFTDEQKKLFAVPALLSAALAAEIKDDDGSVYASLRTPDSEFVPTCITETDGRLRGYIDLKQPDPLLDRDCVLTVGRKLAVRGDYQSTVAAKTPEGAALAYFINSSQTKASLSYRIGEESVLCLAEYLPGHDVNTSESRESELKDRFPELEEARRLAEEKETDIPGAVHYADIPLTYGCTCSKRKLRVILEEQGIEVREGLEAVCRLCGKSYTF